VRGVDIGTGACMSDEHDEHDEHDELKPHMG
jgi:hypothetical protein